jgi:hypothetical protein
MLDISAFSLPHRVDKLRFRVPSPYAVDSFYTPAKHESAGRASLLRNRDKGVASLQVQRSDIVLRVRNSVPQFKGDMSRKLK